MINFRVAAAASDKPAEMYLYDDIGPAWAGMIGAETVIGALQEIGPRDVDVRINSPGGDVFEGMAIYNALLRHRGTVNVHVDALAASIASVIAMAGRKISIAENAMVMIHNAWTIVMGNEAELRRTADLLGQIDGNIVATYAARTENTAEELQGWMTAETWMTAAESIERGFADEIGQPLNGVEASVRAGRYRNTPQRFVQPAAGKGKGCPAPTPAADPAPTAADVLRQRASLTIAAARRRMDMRRRGV